MAGGRLAGGAGHTVTVTATPRMLLECEFEVLAW